MIGKSDYGKPESLDFVDPAARRHRPRRRLPRPACASLAGGGPPGGKDFLDLTYSWFPWLVVAVLLATYVLLVRAFRSLLLPLKAIILNLLSIGAAYGLLVVVFKWGAGERLGLISYDQIEGWIPVMLFAMLFGLSMDYEVFLVSRMREEWDAGASNEDAVVVGLEKTGRLVTAAGLIMFAAFMGFVAGSIVGLQQFGFGLAAAILIDVTIVRSLLVPSRDEALRPLQLVAAGRRRAHRPRALLTARPARPAPEAVWQVGRGERRATCTPRPASAARSPSGPSRSSPGSSSSPSGSCSCSSRSSASRPGTFSTRASPSTRRFPSGRRTSSSRLCVLVVAWLLGATVGPGTVANAICIGLFVDGLLAVDAVDSLSDSPLAARIAFMFAGVLVIGLGSGLYIGAGMGAGPAGLAHARRRAPRPCPHRRRAGCDRGRRHGRRLRPRRHGRDRHARLRVRDRTRRRALVLGAGADAVRRCRPRPVPRRVTVSIGAMKGLVCAGGEATRLGELTRVTNKHLLPVGHWPMVYYPLQLLQLAGIREVLVVTGKGHAGQMIDLLGDGHLTTRDGDAPLLELDLTYKVQTRPGGIAEVVGMAEDFAGGEQLVVVLGDNIFEYSHAGRDRGMGLGSDGARRRSSRTSRTRRTSASSSTTTRAPSSISPRRPASSTSAIRRPPTSDAVVGLYCYPPGCVRGDRGPRAVEPRGARDHRRQPRLRRRAAGSPSSRCEAGGRTPASTGSTWPRSGARSTRRA